MIHSERQGRFHLLCGPKSNSEDDEPIEQVRQAHGNHHPHTSGNGPVPADTHKFFDAKNGIKKRNDKGKQIKGDVGNHRPFIIS